VQAAFNPALVRGLGTIFGYGPETGYPVGVGNGGAPGVKFITTNVGRCTNWFLAATQGVSKPNAIVEGSTLNFGTLFLNIARVAGPGLQYFTYEGHLYKFWYTGYDTKTGKYNHGSQYKNNIYVCTDGMSVLKNPDGTSKYLIVPNSSGGLVETVHEPRQTKPMKFYRSPASLLSSANKESSMETAFNARGLGQTPTDGDHAFNPALLRGLGVMPKVKIEPITTTPKPTLKPPYTISSIVSPIVSPIVSSPSSPSLPPYLTSATPIQIVAPSAPTVAPASPAVPLPSGAYGTYVPPPMAGVQTAPMSTSTPAPVVASAIPTVAYIMLGLLGVGILGGLVYIYSGTGAQT